MAYTGKKYKGSRILTPKTVENRETFYNLLSEIKELDPEEYKTLKELMFERMFNNLSHTSQEDILRWARNANWKCKFEK